MSRKLSSAAVAVAVLFVMAVSPALAGEAPAIVSRSEWNAKEPAHEMKPQKPKRILVHHTGSKKHLGASILKKMANLQRFSQAKEKLADGRTKLAWADVPYHFYVDAEGKIAEGRAITAEGDTNTKYDPSGYVQVVLEGNFEIEEPSDAQIKSLKALTLWLSGRYAIDSEDVSYHQAVAQTACPGKNLIDRMKDVKSVVTD
jgi:hypothetical protein